MKLFECPVCREDATDYSKSSGSTSLKERMSIVGQCSHCSTKTVMDYKVVIEFVIYLMTLGLLLGYFNDPIVQKFCEVISYFEFEEFEKCTNSHQFFQILMFVLTFVIPWAMINILNRRLYKAL